MDRQARVRLSPILVLVGHVDAVDLLRRRLAQQCAQVGDQAGIGSGAHRALADGDAARQHADARDKTIELIGGSAKLGDRLGRRLSFELNPARAVV